MGSLRLLMTGPGCPGLGELGGLPTQAIGASIKDEGTAPSRLNREDGATIENQACKAAWPADSWWAAGMAATRTTCFTMNSSLAVVRIVGLGVSLLICLESGSLPPDEEHTPSSFQPTQFLCQAIAAVRNCLQAIEMIDPLEEFSNRWSHWGCWS